MNLLFLHHARENGEAEQRERAGIECKRVSGGWAECTAGSRQSCHRAAVAALSHHSLPQPSHAMRLTELSLSLSVPQTLRGKRALHVCWAASASSVSWRLSVISFVSPITGDFEETIKKSIFFVTFRDCQEKIRRMGGVKRKLTTFSVVLLAISLQVQFIFLIFILQN